MSYHKKQESGAIIFHLTEEEQTVRNLTAELLDMKKDLQKELDRVKKIKK